MDQKWILLILLILVFYQSKFNLIFLQISNCYIVIALKCSLVFLLVLCFWVPRNTEVIYINAPIFHILEITSGAVQITVKEGESYEISCKPAEIGGMIVWFRVLDKSGMEFIASFSTSGLQKSSAPFKPTFSAAKINQNILILNSFNKIDDSGMYSCASIKNNELKFGQVTQLVVGEFYFINLV